MDRWNYDRCACGNTKRNQAKMCGWCRDRMTEHVQNNILRLMALGLSRAQIQRTLGFKSISSVGEYMAGIRERFNTNSLFKIALRARELGIVCLALLLCSCSVPPYSPVPPARTNQIPLKYSQIKRTLVPTGPRRTALVISNDDRGPLFFRVESSTDIRSWSYFTNWLVFPGWNTNPISTKDAHRFFRVARPVNS